MFFFCSTQAAISIVSEKKKKKTQMAFMNHLVGCYIFRVKTILDQNQLLIWGDILTNPVHLHMF